MTFGTMNRLTGRMNRPAKTFRYNLLLTTTAISLLCAVSDSVAQSAPPAQNEAAATRGVARAFNIPAQPLAGALSAFSRQSGLQVTQAAGTARGVSGNAVIGSFTPDQALARLLSGTGINYRISGDNAAVIGESAGSSAAAAASGDGSTVLDTITVVGRGDRNAATGSGFQGTPDWVYEAPASVSVVSREAIQNSGARNARDLLDNVAGVYANRSEGQNPGISVNVRGLQDQNRVITSIDGVRQNFQRSGHGSSSLVYVDPALLRTIDIEKSGNARAGSAGALAGVVNFRTLEAGDVIKSGETMGGFLDIGTGTNAHNFEGSAAGAMQFSDSFSFLGAASLKRFGEYDPGKNGELKLFNDYFAQYFTRTLNSNNALVFTGSESASGLAKFEMQPLDDLSVTASWLHHRSTSSQGYYLPEGVEEIDVQATDQTVINDTVSLTGHWDPDSDLIDLKAQLSFNRLDNKETRGSASRMGTTYEDAVNYRMETWGGSIENTSLFTLPVGELSLNYGVEAFHDKAKTTGASMMDELNVIDYSFGYKGTNPTGSRTVASSFTSATLEHDDWLEVTAGLRYDHYNMSGSTTVHSPLRWRAVPQAPVAISVPGACFTYPASVLAVPSFMTYINSQVATGATWDLASRTLCAVPTIKYVPQADLQVPYIESTEINVDRSEGAWLPSATIAVKPFEWLQPFVSYSKTFRPPTIMESLFAGGHPMAPPGAYAPNSSLIAERGETWEIGANIRQDGVFNDYDTFRMKVVAFNRDIDNYITMGRVDRSDFATGTGSVATYSYGSFVNLVGTTKMRGVEIEGSYDAGDYYIGGSYTHLKADYASEYLYNGKVDYAYAGMVFEPPRYKITLDGGLRFFDERLVLGARANIVGDSKPAFGYLSNTFVTDKYTVFDIYGSYDISENAKLRFTVKNVADKAYVPALGYSALPAPGRTFSASLNFTF
ncbi:TonB-dependent receptor [Rhizobium sp. RM]|uniref:TonB-dependent receptor n=1 Tax=Rhizobium sp. RM TaxID=2748079 RepID=UPI00110F0B26|nr:TonB-dependent receptor [Rhizobium sp. RM]NWJ25523.1 TonB-dependent hemoglobin/transferrin/lactoferrin family receptor [Rhizobium sp. RM]TMV22161.1 TonB-dependent hemoglobin/transferrin/lactoferrin family receptor [Rhizobium sp. Td3]